MSKSDLLLDYCRLTLEDGERVPVRRVTVKSTIFKAQLQVNDSDRNYFHAHSLTLARHPSETDERLMVRLLAFALHAHDTLQFARGLAFNEPDLWRKDLTGAIDLWIAVGQPDEQQMRQACGRARQVVVYEANHDLHEVVAEIVEATKA